MSSLNDLRESSLKGMFFSGTVVDRNDPLRKKRVRIRVPVIFDDTPDEELPWAYPNSGLRSIGVPDLGTDLLIIFDRGDISSPLYLGKLRTISNVEEILGTNYEETYGFQDKNGNRFYVDMSNNTIRLEHTSGSFVNINSDGAIAVNAMDNVTVNCEDLNVTCTNATVDATQNVTVTAALIQHN